MRPSDGVAAAVVVAVFGILVGLVLLCYRPNVDRPAVLDQAAGQITDAEHVRTAAAISVESAKATAHVMEVEAEAAVSRASAARARAHVVNAGVVRVSATPNAVPQDLRVPPPVAERMQLDSTAIATLGTLAQWKDTVILRQDRRISADSIELVATSHAFAALQRVKEPRCGRRCGIVLGVGGVIAAAVAVEQVRRIIR